MKNPGIFIDTGVHDIDLTLSFLGSSARPKSCYGVGSIALHQELAEIQDVDNAVGTVEWYPASEGAAAPISYYFISRIMQHGFDNPTEIIGTKGVLKINLNPRRDLVTVADEKGIGNDVSPDFYERYEHAFVKELSVFADCVLDAKALPYELDVALKGMEIAEALYVHQREEGLSLQADAVANEMISSHRLAQPSCCCGESCLEASSPEPRL